MRAETETWRVNIEVTSEDRADGAYYLNKSVELSADSSDKDHGLWEFATSNGTQVGVAKGNYDTNSVAAVVANLIDFRSGSYLAKNPYTDVVVTVYDANGLYVSSYEYDFSGTKDTARSLLQERVADDWTVRFEFVVDNYKAGELSTVKGGDDIDDRDQALITVLMARNPYSTDYRSNSPTYVVNKGENVQALIEEGTYANFPGYDDEDSYWYDRDKDIEYIRVYDNALTKVTEDVKIHGDWAEDKAGLDRFTPAATNDKDTNGDGKVSCDEYYGTTGLEWSDKLNACVVSSTGDAVVTIPNTATK